MKNFRFQLQTKFPFSAETVCAWHDRAGAIERLFPPGVKAELTKRTGGPFTEGSQVELKIKWNDFRWTWLLEHTGGVPGQEFTDRQLLGPLHSYVHRHRFVPVDPTSCFLIDEIAYQTKIPFLGNYLQRDFEKYFSWRHRRLLEDLKLLTQHPVPELRILLTGSSGLVGSSLLTFLRTAGHRVTRLVRRVEDEKGDTLYWDPLNLKSVREQLEGFDAVIHLAGENIAEGRWTKKKKQRLKSSRCAYSESLAEILSQLQHPPKTVLCASAVGFYGDRGNEVLTEGSEAGEGFLPELCVEWERAFHGLQASGVRVVHLRFGSILSASGGILSKLMFPFKCGLGGKLGTGKQMMSWVGLDDAIGALYHALVSQDLSGPINVTSPRAVSQAEFARTLARRLHRFAWLPVPKWLLKIVFGEMADALLLSSAHVVPEKLLRSGYEFRSSELEDALTQAIVF